MSEQSSDFLQRFIFKTLPVRGQFVRLQTSMQMAMKERSYSNPLRQLLAQALVAAPMLSSLIKNSANIRLQLQDDHQRNILLAQCDNEMHIRGYAKWTSPEIEKVYSQLYPGQLLISLEPEEGDAFQGVVALAKEGLDQSVQDYFVQSEQINTWLRIISTETEAVGMFLQQMPVPPTEQESALRHWEHARILAATVTTDELLNWTNEQLLRRLFAEETIELFEAQPIRFECSCSNERISQLIIALGKEEMTKAAEENNELAITCEFCGKHYIFDKIDLAQLFATGEIMQVSNQKH